MKPGSRRELLTAPVGASLVQLALPMAIGIVAIVFFNIVDTFWVGHLGKIPLAAMGFTFPVTFVVKAVMMGLSIGATAVIAQAIGSDEGEQVRKLTTHSLVLAVAVVGAFSAAGLLVMRPLFRLLGASPQMLKLIASYMTPWFLGIPCLGVPIMGNSAIRATGDTRTPAMVMIMAGLINAAFDPFLIFGWGPFPRLELEGAALATVFSWALAMVTVLWLLSRRFDMVQWRGFKFREAVSSWRRVLHIGIPAAGTNLLAPLSSGILTRMVAGFGAAAVAGFGVATRVEAVVAVGVMAMAAAVTPFVGQNYGAGAWPRIERAMRFAFIFCLAWGALLAALLIPASRLIVGIFSTDPIVIARGALYLQVVPLSYAAFGIAAVSGSGFNAVGRPLRAAFLVGVRLLVLTIPLAWLGRAWWGVTGIFGAIAVGNIAGGVLAYLMVRSYIRGKASTFIPVVREAPRP
ncbi:MAG: MATE family efflux transporter [Acidobacteria bacterium]|nr:MATE family efflux transporter [Acidobacteriota bacterium]